MQYLEKYSHHLVKAKFSVIDCHPHNILYANIPYELKNMTLCFSFENRSNFHSHTNINDGRLPVVYYKDFLLIINYELKLIFQDGIGVPL